MPTEPLDLQSPPGTSLRAPGEADLMRALTRRALDMARLHGYRVAQVPMYERFEHYASLYGDAIRTRLLTFSTDREYALRPDLTLGLCRLVAQGLDADGAPPLSPVRLAGAGSAFRYERVRPLRLREFTQISVERIGDAPEDVPGADLECISLSRVMLQACGLPGGLLRVSHAKARAWLMEALFAQPAARARASVLLDHATRVRERFSPPRTGADLLHQPDGPALRLPPAAHPDAPHALAEHRRALRRLGLSPSTAPDDDTPAALLRDLEDALTALSLQAGHSPAARDALLDLTHSAASLGAVIDALTPALPEAEARLSEALGHIDACVEELEPLTLRFSLGTVRTLNYYTGVMFELDVPVLGPDTCQLMGGGRYDGVMSAIGAQPMPAAGFAVGIERLSDALKSLFGPTRVAHAMIAPKPILIAFTHLEADQLLAAAIAEELKAHRVNAALHPRPLPSGGLTSDLRPSPAFLAGVAAVPSQPYRYVLSVASGKLHLADLERDTVHVTDFGTLLSMLTDAPGG